MLAHLLIITVAIFPEGAVNVQIKFPMPSMAACDLYVKDKAPILVAGVRPITLRCVDEPTDKGKPV